MKTKKYKSNYFNLSRKIGIIFLDKSLFDNPEHELLTAIFSCFFPTQIDEKIRPHVENTEFTLLKMVGFSKYFRELEEHEDVPEYVFELKYGIIDVSVFDVKENHIQRKEGLNKPSLN